MEHFVLMISLDLTKSSEVRIVGDRSNIDMREHEIKTNKNSTFELFGAV